MRPRGVSCWTPCLPHQVSGVCLPSNVCPPDMPVLLVRCVIRGFADGVYARLSGVAFQRPRGLLPLVFGNGNGAQSSREQRRTAEFAVCHGHRTWPGRCVNVVRYASSLVSVVSLCRADEVPSPPCFCVSLLFLVGWQCVCGCGRPTRCLHSNVRPNPGSGRAPIHASFLHILGRR
jgi:hypothetical protein